MKNRYDKVMQNIEVTQEMRDRILTNIKSLDPAKAPKKAPLATKYKRYISIAACLVLLLVGSVLILNMINAAKEPLQQAIPDIQDYGSVQELSKAVGFTVKEIRNVPFKADSVQYTDYWGKLAQIQYTGQTNTVSIRMAKGSDDISGDYTEYTDVKKLSISGNAVTLKGDGGKYALALWQSGGYSYAVEFDDAVSEQEITDTVQSVQ